MSITTIKSKLLLTLSNFIVAYLWSRVLVVSIIWRRFSGPSYQLSSHHCETVVRPRVNTALWVSCIELVQALGGLTSSNPNQVFLFASVRLFVELYLSNLVECNAWQHEMTIACWSVGEVIRFSCFAMDSILSFNKNIRVFKTIRYEVSRLLFPLGALSELLLVIHCAMKTKRLELYVAAALWPLGFLPLMRRLLKQRSNHVLMKEKNVFV
jgi:hypothetical protein